MVGAFEELVNHAGPCTLEGVGVLSEASRNGFPEPISGDGRQLCSGEVADPDGAQRQVEGERRPVRGRGGDRVPRGNIEGTAHHYLEGFAGSVRRRDGAGAGAVTLQQVMVERSGGNGPWFGVGRRKDCGGRRAHVQGCFIGARDVCR